MYLYTRQGFLGWRYLLFQEISVPTRLDGCRGGVDTWENDGTFVLRVLLGGHYQSISWGSGALPANSFPTTCRQLI